MRKENLCVSDGVCVCVSLQEWPSLSWCSWPVWTPAPTRGSTQLSPAACPESCRTSCTAGHDPGDGAPCLTTPPPHTPPPPRTASIDRCDRNRDDWKDIRGRTCALCKDVLLHTTPPPPPPENIKRLHQMFLIKKDSCTVERKSICNNLSSPHQQWQRVSLKVSTLYYITARFRIHSGSRDSFCNARWPCSKQIFTSVAVEWDLGRWFIGGKLFLKRGSAVGTQGMDHRCNGTPDAQSSRQSRGCRDQKVTHTHT